MASEPSRRTSLRLDLSQTSPLDSPPGIAALFLIRFDVKTGYLISWQKSLPTVEIEAAVEYKSLPSGLHNVKEDLVYFVHDQYVGLSAFVNQPASESERNALMLAVGVLVPLSFGRLGKCWRHAAGLKELALICARDIDEHQPLVDYWEKHHVTDESAPAVESPIDSPSSQRTYSRFERPDTFRRNRLPSDATGVDAARASLAPFHPALSLPDFVDTFGPLLFPLYRTALLRKRILFVTEAPVQTSCDYVYDLSLFSSLPHSLSAILPTQNATPFRPRPLFNVGVHDIPYLSTLADIEALPRSLSNWIACTTDNVLTMKSELYDILVTLPPSYSKNAAERVYPKIEFLSERAKKENLPKLTRLKATQRDTRRFVTLRDGLRFLPRDNHPDGYQDDQDAASTFSSASIVEPLSWTRLAYTSFLWWASAGEKRTGISEEEEEQVEQDSRLLASVETTPGMMSNSLNASGLNVDDGHNQQPQEIALIAYFRRLTTLIFTTLSDAVARQDSEDIEDEVGDFEQSRASGYQEESEADDGSGQVRFRADDTAGAGATTDDEQPLLGDGRVDDTSSPVLITASDMADMGLDAWSTTDRIFVEEMLQLWWGRQAHVDGTRIRCCGIAIL